MEGLLCPSFLECTLVKSKTLTYNVDLPVGDKCLFKVPLGDLAY